MGGETGASGGGGGAEAAAGPCHPKGPGLSQPAGVTAETTADRWAHHEGCIAGWGRPGGAAGWAARRAQAALAGERRQLRVRAAREAVVFVACDIVCDCD